MMSMDIILLSILSIFILAGFFLGFVKSFGSFLGMLLSIIIAGNLFEGFAQTFRFIFLGNVNLARIVVFTVLFILISKLLGIFFWIINSLFKIVSVVPFVKSINRILGALLGLVEGVFAIGMVLFMMLKFPLATDISLMLATSKVAKALLMAAQILSPLLPAELRDVVGLT